MYTQAIEHDRKRLNELLDSIVDGADTSCTSSYWDGVVKHTHTASGPIRVDGVRVYHPGSIDIRDAEGELTVVITEVSTQIQAPVPIPFLGFDYVPALHEAAMHGGKVTVSFSSPDWPADRVDKTGDLVEQDDELFLVIREKLAGVDVDGYLWIRMTTDFGRKPRHEPVVGVTRYEQKNVVWRGGLCDENVDEDLERLRQKLRGEPSA